MKNEADLKRYLRLSKGDLNEAFRIACKEHDAMDQTLDMKRVQMEKLLKGEGDE